MPSLQVGKSSIQHELRRSSGSAERRITVTPDGIEVVTLTTDSDSEVAAFLNRKREWLFRTLREVTEAAARRHAVPTLMTGSNILYRGRKKALTVRRSDLARMSVTYRNGFWVNRSDSVGDAGDEVVATELRLWLKSRARQEAKAATARLGSKMNLSRDQSAWPI